MSRKKKPTTKSGSDKRSLRPTDMCVLRHVVLYQLAFRESVAAAVFHEAENPENAAANALAALAKQGYLRDTHGGKPLSFTDKTKKHRYYLLGTEGAKVLSVPKERKQTPKPDALRNRLAILWACTLDPSGRRHRLEQPEKTELFGEDAPHHNVPLVVANESDGQVVYQILVASGSAKNSVKAARLAYDRTIAKPGLQPWVESGDFGFAILSETESKVADVVALLDQQIGKNPPLTSQGRFISSLGPSPQTFELALQAVKER